MIGPGWSGVSSSSVPSAVGPPPGECPRSIPKVFSGSRWPVPFTAAFLFHELGHLVLGDIVRFRLIGFGVGPLSWAYAGGRWRAHMRYDKLLGGHTAMVPTTPRNIRGRVMILTLGGPLASAMLGRDRSDLPLIDSGARMAGGAGPDRRARHRLCLWRLPLQSAAHGERSSIFRRRAFLWQMYRRGPWCDFHCANHYMGLCRAPRRCVRAIGPRPWWNVPAEFAAQASRIRRIVRHGLPALPGPWRLGARPRLARQGAPAGPSRQQTCAAPSPSIVRIWKLSIAATAGKHSALFDQAPGGKIRPITGASAATVRATQGDLAGASEAWNKAWEMAAEAPGHRCL